MPPRDEIDEDAAGEPDLSDEIEEEEQETPEGDEAEDSDEEQPEAETDEGESEDAIGADLREEDLPEELRPVLRAAQRRLQADYTRKSQANAQARRETEAERKRLAAAAQLADEFAAMGIDPEALLPALATMQSQPAERAGLAPDPADDPEVAEAQRDYVVAAQTYGEESHEARAAARQIRILTKQAEIDARTQAADRRQAEAARAQAHSTELTSLQASEIYGPILRNPADQRAVMQFAAARGLTLQQAANALHADQLYASGFAKGRGVKSAGQGASLPRNTRATSGRKTKGEYPNETRKSIRAMGEYRDLHPELDWDGVR